jgi:hypothetical protein
MSSGVDYPSATVVNLTLADASVNIALLGP